VANLNALLFPDSLPKSLDGLYHLLRKLGIQEEPHVGVGEVAHQGHVREGQGCQAKGLTWKK